MKKEIYQGSAYSVDTDNGIEIVPLDVVGDLGIVQGEYLSSDDGDKFTAVANALADYVAGEIITIERVSGYLGRLSMPGYLDATDWIIMSTEEGVSDALDEMYGDDEAAG